MLAKRHDPPLCPWTRKFESGGPLLPRRWSAQGADALQSFYNDTALHVPERFRAEFAPSASPMKVNSRAVSFATLIQFSGAVPGKTSSLNLARAQPSMAGRDRKSTRLNSSH